MQCVNNTSDLLSCLGNGNTKCVRTLPRHWFAVQFLLLIFRSIFPSIEIVWWRVLLAILESSLASPPIVQYSLLFWGQMSLMSALLAYLAINKRRINDRIRLSNVHAKCIKEHIWSRSMMQCIKTRIGQQDYYMSRQYSCVFAMSRGSENAIHTVLFS